MANKSGLLEAEFSLFSPVLFCFLLIFLDFLDFLLFCLLNLYLLRFSFVPFSLIVIHCSVLLFTFFMCSLRSYFVFFCFSLLIFSVFFWFFWFFLSLRSPSFLFEFFPFFVIFCFVLFWLFLFSFVSGRMVQNSSIYGNHFL